MSDPELPPTPPPEAPPPEVPPPAASTPEPKRPVLSATPAWVPASVVGGVVVFLLGFLLGAIEFGDEEKTRQVVHDIGQAGMAVGFLSLAAGYFAFLLARVDLSDAILSLVLSGVAVVAYYVGWNVLLGSLGGKAADLFFVEWISKATPLSGKAAAVVAILGGLLCAAAFLASFWTTCRLVWPYFRAGVALNVVAMVHIVVLLLGVVSYLNLTFTPAKIGSGIDLTSTRQFSLSDKSRALLGRVDGDLTAILVDYGAGRRGGAGSMTSRVKDLLREYQANCPRLTSRVIDAFRGGDELRQALQEAGMTDVLSQLTGEDDCVVLAYRPPGEKLVARTKVVPVDQEFSDVSALGSGRFKGEGILTNAMNEVVFVRRRVLFVEGHGERPITGGVATTSMTALKDALVADNFAVGPLNLAKEGAVPKDADVLILAAPATAIPSGEVEILRSYLQEGGVLVVFLEPTLQGEHLTGMEDLFAAWGLAPRRDVVIVSFLAERTALSGVQTKPATEVFVQKEEYGRHPALEALRGTGIPTFFSAVAPALRAEKVPEGVTVEELAYAPREVAGEKPFGAILRKGRALGGRPEPGDLVDRRLPVGITAERKVGGTDKGGGRLVLFGDADFISDLRIDSRSPAATPGNRTLFLNTLSWAVRRNLIAIDPKTVETEVVTLRPVDRALVQWVAVFALPLMALGLAVGVWWSRRR